MLTRDKALAFARLCGSVMLWVPASGRAVLATMRKSFLMEDAEAKRSAREYLAQPFYSFVVFHRILRHREHPDSWKIEERNNHDVAQLRDSGRSFIVATGHFRRESYVALHMPRCCPGSLAPVFVPVPVRSLRPHNIRTRLAFGQLLQVVQHSRPDSKFVYVGGAGGAFGELLRHLKQPSCQVVVSVDAFWKAAGSNAYTRPFAGMRARTFSIGAAKLSRLAQCPIVACATYVANDGAVVLEWGPVTPPPELDDEAVDFQTTNAILDFLQDAIGRRPAQYVLYIGEERRWKPVLRTWEDRGAEVR